MRTRSWMRTTLSAGVRASVRLARFVPSLASRGVRSDSMRAAGWRVRSAASASPSAERCESRRKSISPSPTSNPKAESLPSCPSDDVQDRSDDFGSPAVLLRCSGEDPWLCGPAFQLVCPCRVIVRSGGAYLRNCIRANGVAGISA
jgi:hypothetical protein